MRFSLRFKLALISLFLLAIPLTGFRLSTLIKNSLFASRKEALTFSARAVASALSGREGLFDKEGFHKLNKNKDLYLYRLTNPMRLNGKIDDWQNDLANAQEYGFEHVLSGAKNYTPTGSGFTHLLGQRGNYLYALFIVRDDSVIYRERNTLALNHSDHLIITIERQNNHHETYIISPQEPGWVNGFLATHYADKVLSKRMEPRIQGVWQPNSKGYIIELRIPLDMLGRKLAFAIGDVDDPVTRKVVCTIGTANTEQPEQIGWLLKQSSVLQDILHTLNRPQSRIQIVDRNKHIRASYGSLNASPEDEQEEIPQHHAFSLYHLLSPLFHMVTQPLFNNIPETPAQPAARNLEGVDDALNGNSSISSYRLKEGNVEIMAAVTPLYENDTIIGAVIVEQTTNSILALQNRLIEESFALTLTVLIFGGCCLLFFAFKLSSRIRRLSNSAAQSVGSNGQILNIPQASRSSDEIGDLSRTLQMVLTRLKAQEQYHEKMADNLEHEMRTPLAGASASLKNLTNELVEMPPRIHNYVTWALRDIKRMEDLLTAIRDATSLSNALDRGFKEQFNLGEALQVWLEHGWSQTFADVEFQTQISGEDLFIQGDPDRILQVLDKLIENGVAFHVQATPIEIHLREEKSNILLTVFNQGPHIPVNMQEEIFNSMVSARTSQDQKPHLGLGLFIVRTVIHHHGGTVQAQNIHTDKTGVCFSITLPRVPHAD